MHASKNSAAGSNRSIACPSLKNRMQAKPDRQFAEYICSQSHRLTQLLPFGMQDLRAAAEDRRFSESPTKKPSAATAWRKCKSTLLCLSVAAEGRIKNCSPIQLILSKPTARF